MKIKRLYVGNLPLSTTEPSIRKKFSVLGSIASVDIRYKDDSVYGFLDVQTSDPIYLQSAIKKLNNVEWNGRVIRIENAKENFLSRLNKEREETLANGQEKNVNSQSGSNVQDKQNKVGNGNEVDSLSLDYSQDVPMFNGLEKCFDGKNDNLPVSETSSMNENKEKSIKRKNTSSVLNSFEMFSDYWKDAEESEPINVKKFKISKSKTSGTVLKEGLDEMQFGVISDDKAPPSIHIKNSKIEKHVNDDSKRLASMGEKLKCKNQQARLISEALSLIDNPTKQNKKIIFDDDDDEGNTKTHPHHKITPKPMLPLFDDDNCSENVNFIEVQHQYEGKKGQKLLALQTNMNNDSRFKLDDRFLESDDDVGKQNENNNNSDKDNLEKEKEHQLELLNCVIGPAVSTSEDKKSKLQMSAEMLRFDPNQPAHEKFVLKDKNKGVPEKEQPLKKKKVPESLETSKEVLNEKFYKVTDSISKSFVKDNSFSLLQMFGRTEDYEDKTNSEFVVKIAQKKVTEVEKERHENKLEQNQIQTPVQVKGVWQESLFFTPNDERLQEGIMFINKFNSEEFHQAAENYPELRKELKTIFRAQIQRNKNKKNPFKNKIGGGKRKFNKKNNSIKRGFMKNK